MKIDLSANNDYVFKDYSEDYLFDRINFKGYLRDRFVDCSDKEIIYFISGSLKDVDYKLIRDGGYIRGYIYISPVKSSKSKGKVKIDDEIIEFARDMYKSGDRICDIACRFGISDNTISRIVHYRDRFKYI